MKLNIALAMMLSSRVLGVDLTFVSGKNCSGKALYGRKNLPRIPCYDMSYLDPTKSVIVANLSLGQSVSFYSDPTCEHQLYKTSVDVCYTEPDRHVRSFQIHTNGTNSTSDRLPSSKDVVPYGVRLSNYQGLTHASPYHIDLMWSKFALGIVASVIGQLTVLSSIAIGCALTDSTNVIGIIGCIIGPIGTVVSYVGALLLRNTGRVFNQAINLATGTISDVKRKRELIDNANFQFMSDIMKRDGLEAGTHVGFQQRDMGNGDIQRSPLYEVDFGKGGLYHVTAFLDQRSGQFIHHMHRAADSSLEARYDNLNRRQVSYDDVRWNSGGLDWSVCMFGGSASGWEAEPSANWQTAYDQLSCALFGSNIATTATNLAIDLYNSASTVVASVQIVGYSGSDLVPPPDCSNPTGRLNEDCIIS